MPLAIRPTQTSVIRRMATPFPAERMANRNTAIRIRFPPFQVKRWRSLLPCRDQLTTNSVRKGEKEEMTKQENKRLARIATKLGIAGIALAATLGIAACGDDDDASGDSGAGGG